MVQQSKSEQNHSIHKLSLDNNCTYSFKFKNEAGDVISHETVKELQSGRKVIVVHHRPVKALRLQQQENKFVPEVLDDENDMIMKNDTPKFTDEYRY